MYHCFNAKSQPNEVVSHLTWWKRKGERVENNCWISNQKTVRFNTEFKLVCSEIRMEMICEQSDCRFPMSAKKFLFGMKSKRSLFSEDISDWKLSFGGGKDLSCKWFGLTRTDIVIFGLF
ncbi:hypothetical protein CDAR_487321 [Caerostris darwini]|uniref:Uncharacterized protein n=1 Tax=Caerostris darwini TaxID=1538125 RepID=A0AAV4VZT7_9ARAC|nr:hypothetical protein CDAR_487321 [Caerostris darwini]